jgi:hypothetical protein
VWCIYAFHFSDSDSSSNNWQRPQYTSMARLFGAGSAWENLIQRIMSLSRWLTRQTKIFSRCLVAMVADSGEKYRHQSCQHPLTPWRWSKYGEDVGSRWTRCVQLSEPWILFGVLSVQCNFASGARSTVLSCTLLCKSCSRSSHFIPLMPTMQLYPLVRVTLSVVLTGAEAVAKNVPWLFARHRRICMIPSGYLCAGNAEARNGAASTVNHMLCSTGDVFACGSYEDAFSGRSTAARLILSILAVLLHEESSFTHIQGFKWSRAGKYLLYLINFLF